MPIYSQLFKNTIGFRGTFNNISIGKWKASIYNYKMLFISGIVEYYNNLTSSSYSYNAITKKLISYNIITIV